MCSNSIVRPISQIYLKEQYLRSKVACCMEKEAMEEKYITPNLPWCGYESPKENYVTCD